MSRTHLARAAALVGSAAAAAALAFPTPANAATFTSPGEPYNVGATSKTITVTGKTSGPKGVTRTVVLAQCNSSAQPGTRCNGPAQIFQVPAGQETFSRQITLNQSFNDTNTRLGAPAGTRTTCRGASGDLCQIQVSEYTSWPPAPGSHVGADYLDLRFP